MMEISGATREAAEAALAKSAARREKRFLVFHFDSALDAVSTVSILALGSATGFVSIVPILSCEAGSAGFPLPVSTMAILPVF